MLIKALIVIALAAAGMAAFWKFRIERLKRDLRDSEERAAALAEELSLVRTELESTLEYMAAKKSLDEVQKEEIDAIEESTGEARHHLVIKLLGRLHGGLQDDD